MSTKDLSKTIETIDKEVSSLEKEKNLEKIISEIEKSTEISVGDLEDKAAEISYEEKTTEIKLNKTFEDTLTDNTLENDLFNLIDSMYDDKED